MKAISIAEFNRMTNNEKWMMLSEAYSEIRELNRELDACKAELKAIQKDEEKGK